MSPTSWGTLSPPLPPPPPGPPRRSVGAPVTGAPRARTSPPAPAAWKKKAPSPPTKHERLPILLSDSQDSSSEDESYDPSHRVRRKRKCKQPEPAVSVVCALTGDLACTSREIQRLHAENGLEPLTVPDLRRLCARLGLAGLSGLKKADLLSRLEAHAHMARPRCGPAPGAESEGGASQAAAGPVSGVADAEGGSDDGKGCGMPDTAGRADEVRGV